MKIQKPLPKKQYQIVYSISVHAGTVITATDFDEAEILAREKWSNRFKIGLPTFGFSATPNFCLTDRIFLREHKVDLIDRELSNHSDHWVHFLKAAINSNFNELPYFNVFLYFDLKFVDPIPVSAVDEEDFQEVVKDFKIDQKLFDTSLTLQVIEDDEDKSGFWFKVEMDNIKRIPKLIIV